MFLQLPKLYKSFMESYYRCLVLSIVYIIFFEIKLESCLEQNGIIHIWYMIISNEMKKLCPSIIIFPFIDQSTRLACVNWGLTQDRLNGYNISGALRISNKYNAKHNMLKNHISLKSAIIPPVFLVIKSGKQVNFREKSYRRIMFKCSLKK